MLFNIYHTVVIAEWQIKNWTELNTFGIAHGRGFFLSLFFFFNSKGTDSQIFGRLYNSIWTIIIVNSIVSGCLPGGFRVCRAEGIPPRLACCLLSRPRFLLIWADWRSAVARKTSRKSTRSVSGHFKLSFHVAVLLLIINFVTTLSKSLWSLGLLWQCHDEIHCL